MSDENEQRPIEPKEVEIANESVDLPIFGRQTSLNSDFRVMNVDPWPEPPPPVEKKD